MRFFSHLNRKHVQVLGIFGTGALTLKEISRKIGGPVGRRFMADLEERGLVEKRKTGKKPAVWNITEEGRKLLAEPPWECAYCGAKTWEGERRVMIVRGDCRVCGAEHRSCKKCARKLTVVTGEFPKYKPALRACPSRTPEAAVQMGP